MSKQVPKVINWENEKELRKYKGHIFSEQWGVEYLNQDKTQIKEILYCTEWKGMRIDVEKQFNLDFPNCKLLKIQYH